MIPKFSSSQWNAEKWKFTTGNELQFFSKATEKVLRFNADLNVDALGEEKDAHSESSCLIGIVLSACLKQVGSLSINNARNCLQAHRIAVASPE